MIRISFNFHLLLVNMTHVFEKQGSESTFFKITSLWNYGISTTKYAFDSPIMKKFIEEDQTQFDLVISEQFQQEAFNMFSHKYNCPLITIATLDYADFMDRAKGALTPLGHVPHFLGYSTDKMSFYERIENLVYSLFDAIGRKFYYLPKHTALAREAFVSLENQQGRQLPSTEELEKKISVHLVNSHAALSYPRPKMPGMVDIAGIHIKKVKPLPTDIQNFLDGATEGVIYMSFGSFLLSSEMPNDKYEAMISVFRRIKQRILWKWEKDEISNLPSNVMVKKWMPQMDILAHKNVKLFIAHGGIFGTQEAIYNAVPLIIFPFYGDQHLNGYKLQSRGVGLLQDMSEMTSESLLKAINTVTQNQSYYQNIQALSDVFRSNQNEPLDTAIWWIEYVLKFKGAKHLESPAKNLPWFRYLLLDIAFVIFGAIYIIYDLLSKMFKKAEEATSDSKKKTSAQKNKKKTN